MVMKGNIGAGFILVSLFSLSFVDTPATVVI